MLCAAVMAFALSACGGSSEPAAENAETTTGTSSTLVAEAAKRVAEAEEPVTWEPPGTPIDVAKIQGKTIFYVSYDLSQTFEQVLAKGIKAGAQAAGVKFVAYDGKGQVGDFARGVEQGVSQKADVIMLGGISSDVVGPPLEKAKRAGIPVITTHTDEPGPLPDDESPAIVASATHSYASPGKTMADFIAADSEGKGQVAFIESSDIKVSGLVKDAFVAQLKEVCPDCDLQTVDVPGAQWKSLQSKTQSLLRSNPDLNYIVPVFDGMTLFILPGVQVGGGGSDVKIVSFNATDRAMQALKSGDHVVADVGSANLLQGWAFADQAFRVLLDEEPLDDIEVPERLFTAKNIDDIDLKGQESSWYTTADYESDYKKLWGVS